MQLTAARAPILTRIANMAWAFSQRYWRVVLVSMLSARSRTRNLAAAAGASATAEAGLARLLAGG